MAKIPSTNQPDVRLHTPPMVAEVEPVSHLAEIMFAISVATNHEGYVARYMNCRRADVKSLSERQRTALAKLTAGLSETKAMLDDGRLVNDRGRAIRWVLERVADELDKISASVVS